MKKCIAIFLLCCSFAFVGCGRDNTQQKIDELTAKIEKLESDATISQSTIEELQQENAFQKEQIKNLKEEKTDLSERVEQLEKSNQEIPGITMKLLWEAWDSGWLTQEDLSSIAYYHQGTYLNEELMGENFEPKPLKPLSVGEEDVLKVFLWLYNGGLRSNRTPADCIIKEYYGVYNGCVVLIYGGLSDGGGDASFMVPIGGVNFQYNDDMIIVVQFK